MTVQSWVDGERNGEAVCVALEDYDRLREALVEIAELAESELVNDAGQAVQVTNRYGNIAREALR